MCFVSGRRPGVARHASNFLSLRRKKVTKERATLLRASLRFATGNLRCSVRVCAAELTARCALRSNNCGKSVHEVRVSCGTRTHTLPCASRHAQKGPRSRTSIRAIAALGRACAARGACARKIGPSEAKARVAVRLFGCSAVHPLLAAPAAGQLRGEHGRPRAHASSSDSPWLSERRAPAQSEFHGAPRNRSDAGLPRSEAKGSQTGGRPFFGDFLSAKRKKVTRTPGDSRPPPSTKARLSNKHAPASTSSARTGSGKSKLPKQ